MATVELTIPPRSAYVAVVRLALASLARKAGLGEEAVDDLKIAVSEACTNAVVANEEAAPGEPVAVTWSEERDRLIVEVADRGGDAGEGGDEVDTQGFSTRLTMSLALLESLVDEFELRPREGGGICTRLILRKAVSPAG